MKIEYDFLKIGSIVKPRPGYLFLDVGNRLGDGVIDTHHTSQPAETTMCSSSLIVDDPTRVTGWVMPTEPVTHIVLHEAPDFDCVASSLLARRLLEAHADGRPRPDNWEAWAPLLSTSASRIDQGKTRLGLPAANAPTIITPYLSLLVLPDLVSGRGLQRKEAWRWVVEQGHHVLELAIDLALLEHASDIDCIDLRGKLGDLQELEQHIDQRIAAFARDAEQIGLRGARTAGASKLDGIYPLHLPDRVDPGRRHSAKMAFIIDPKCGGAFFKSLIRGAFRSEVDATCVFSTEPADPVTGSAGWVHPIISVDPETPFDLRGLGRALEMEETEARVRLSMPRVGAPRPGYDNPDPWYDGRAFGYTIVDAPRWGTVLPSQRVMSVVLDWPRWHHLRLQDLVASAAEELHAVSIPEATRVGALRTLLAFATGDTALDATYQDQWMARAALQFADAVGRADSQMLRDCAPKVTPALIAACATSEQPSVRVWALNCAAAARDEMLAFASTIGRNDLSRAVHIVAAEDEASVAEAIRGVKADRLRRSHTLVIDAAASLISRGRHRCVGPLRDLLTSSATTAALRPAAINLAAYPCDDAFFRDCAQAALAAAVADLQTLKRGSDAVAREWAFLRRTIDESRTIYAFTDAERAAAVAEYEAARERVLSSLHPPAIEWLGALRNSALTPEELNVVGDSVAENRLNFLDALALLSVLGDMPEHVRQHAREQQLQLDRALLVSSEVVRVLQALLDAVLVRAATGRHDGHGAVDVERCAISDAVRQIVSLTGVEPFLARASQLRPALLRTLYRGAPWLLQAGAVFSSEDAPRAGIDVVVSSSGVEAITAAQEVVATRAGAALVHGVFELARAVETEQRIPDSAPSYAAAGLAFRLLPMVAHQQTAPSEHATLKRARELTIRLAAEKELTRRYRDSVVPLATIIESDLRHIVAYRTILADFECSLARLNVLLRAADVLRPLSARSSQCAVKVMEWVVQLPQHGGCDELQEILGLRDDLPESDRDAEAVMWCGRCLEVVSDCFRADARNALNASTLRAALRDIRSLRSQRPDSGLALLLSLALDDVITYLQSWREAYEKLEDAELRHDEAVVDELATAILEISTAAWLQAELKSNSSEEQHRSVIDFFSSVQARADALAAPERAAYASEVRHALGGKRPLLAPHPKESELAVPVGEVTDRAYQRHRRLMHLDSATVDGLFDRLVQRSLERYDLKRARRLIEDYSLTPPSIGFRAWFSGAILTIPLAFLALFVSYDRVAPDYKEAVATRIEIGLVTTVLAVCLLPFLIEGRKRQRLKRHAKRVAGEAMEKSIERLEARKWQLFLPKFLVPVLVGVYSVVLTDEVGVKVAAKIQDGPLLLLLVGFAVASASVLGQLIVRGGGKVTRSNLFLAGAKIFTYAFLIAVALSIIVAPLIRHELKEAQLEFAKDPCRPEDLQQPAFLHIPSQVKIHHFSRVIPTIYPRHIILYGMLGMFLGIFLHGYLHVKDEKVDPI